MISTFANLFFFIVAIASTVVDASSVVANLQSGKHECCKDRAIRVLIIAVVETCIPAVTKGVLVVAMRLPTPKRVAMWANPCASLDPVHCLDGQQSCSHFVRVPRFKAFAADSSCYSLLIAGFHCITTIFAGTISKKMCTIWQQVEGA